MRVRIYPADQWGCGQYRMINPGRALVDQGYDVQVIMPGQDSSGISGLIWEGRVSMIELEGDADADVFVFQRPTNSLCVDLIRLLRQRGKTVVVDMDDDLMRIHPANAAFHILHPKRSPNNNWQLAADGCKMANLITVSTPTLAKRYAKYRPCRVLRNCVPRAYLEIEHRYDGPAVWGWGGSLRSHPDDLPIIGPAVNQLRRAGYEFHIVGNSEGCGRALGLEKDPGGPGTVSFEAWPHHLAELAVGVAPLNDTAFNRSKSWLKPLEYAAVGVPFVASAQDEYSLLCQQGAGSVVKNRTKDWVGAVRRLLADEKWRQEAGQAARQVASQLTIEEHAWRWWETWEQAFEANRQGRSLASQS